jgi:hypothetical protein
MCILGIDMDIYIYIFIYTSIYMHLTELCIYITYMQVGHICYLT